ncbi:MAG: transglycosylase SLT domain-containing protein [Candidatus Paceibacterota bacterium]
MCEGQKLESRACISALITAYAKKYGVSKKLALAIAQCESNIRGNVFGDNGKAYGTFQFHKPTFKEFSAKMGEDLDYYNNEDSIKLAMWALANNKEYHWSCYDKVTN